MKSMLDAARERMQEVKKAVTSLRVPGEGVALPRAALTDRAIAPDPTATMTKVLKTEVADLPVVLSPELTATGPQPVARLRDAAQGQKLLSRLAVGDESALAEVDLSVPPGYNVQGREWGLGVRGQEYWLVAGGAAAIEWDQLPGYRSLAHTHPYEPIDRQAIRASQMMPADNLAATLAAWLRELGDHLTIGVMPGHLAYIFPSNGDLNSGYTDRVTWTEFVYTPFRIGADGWLSTTQGPTLRVAYGPVVAVLAPDLEATAKGTGKLNQYATFEDIEIACVQYFVAPLTFEADGLPDLSRGYLWATPDKSGTAAYKTQKPTQFWARDQVRQLVREALK
jgi:hypothetical protein